MIIAGGAESMSQVEHYSTGVRYGVGGGAAVFHDRLVRARETAGGVNYPVPGGMVETAENLRREYGISRQEQDELALRSHQRAVAAQDKGLFDEEIVPVTVRDRKGNETVISTDEHPRRDTTGVPRRLAAGHGRVRSRGDGHRGQRQRPERCRSGVHRHDTGEGGRARAATVGPAGLVGRRRGRARDHGYRAGSGDREGPRPGRSALADIDLIELNEAFAAQVLACTRSGSSTTRISSG